MYGLSSASMPPNLCASSVDSSISASSTSSTVTMPSICCCASTTGIASKSWRRISRATSSWSISASTVTGGLTWATSRIDSSGNPVISRRMVTTCWRCWLAGSST
ncbi:hypothetical protein G6F66_015360 [Rhizopus arrhizus]|nr:hypothetical protein G6F66_015360 [Rhizopus arrhizus]